jgi:hypothetical protein
MPPKSAHSKYATWAALFLAGATEVIDDTRIPHAHTDGPASPVVQSIVTSTSSRWVVSTGTRAL